MINLGYIGFGKSTNRYHLPYVAERLDQFSVKQIYARTLGKRPVDEATWRERGTVFTDKIDDVLQDKTLDLVVIVTPAPSHYAMVKQALAAGQNVLVDKPLALTLAEAQELIDYAKAHDLLLMSFQNRRFDSDYLTLKHVLDVGYVGEPIELTVNMDHYRPDNGATGAVIDGAWYSHGVHLVDQMVALFGRPERASYAIQALRSNAEDALDDHFSVQMHYRNGLRATVQASELAAVAHPKWVLYGTKGTYIKTNIDQQEYDLKAGILPGMPGFGADAPQDYGQLTYYNQNGDRIEKTIPTIQGDYGRIYDNLGAVLRGEATKMVTDEQMATVIEVLEAGILQKDPHTDTFK